MPDQVDDFLAHYGIPGMKWGRRNSRSDDRSTGTQSGPKPKMSREKKIAIAVGIGATVAIGAAIAISVLNNKKMDLPAASLMKQASTKKGSSLVLNARKTTTAPPDAAELNQYKNKAVKATTDKAKAELAELDRYRVASRDKAIKDRGLTLSPPSSRPGPRAAPTSSGPNLNTLSSLINGGPQVSFNPKTGRYETK